MSPVALQNIWLFFVLTFVVPVGCALHELRIQWADFDMTHKPTEHPLVLSSRYRISLLQRFQLSSLFTNVCLLFFQHADHMLSMCRSEADDVERFDGPSINRQKL